MGGRGHIQRERWDNWTLSWEMWLKHSGDWSQVVSRDGIPGRGDCYLGRGKSTQRHLVAANYPKTKPRKKIFDPILPLRLYPSVLLFLPTPPSTVGPVERHTFGNSGQLRSPRRHQWESLHRCACHGRAGWPATATAGQVSSYHRRSSRSLQASHTLWRQSQPWGTHV